MTASPGGGAGHPRWPLRWKLFAAAAGLALVSLGAGGLIGARLLDRAVAATTEHRMHGEALRLAAAVAGGLGSGGNAAATPSRLDFEREVLGAVGRASGTTVLLVAPDGHILYATGRFGEIAPGRLRLLEAWVSSGGGAGARRIVVGRSTVALAAATVQSGVQLRAFVVVGRSFQQQRAARELVAGMLLRAGVIAVAFSLVLAVVMAERIAVPVRAVAAAAGRLSHGDLSQRVPSRGDDELAALARAFNDMAERLQAAVRGRQELVAAVSHELRTPLTSLQGYIQGLRDGAVPPEAAPQTYDVVAAELARLHRLIEDLSELSRWDAGRLTLTPQDVDAGELLQSAEERGRILAGPDGPEVRSELGAGAGRLHVDPDRVFQVLSNLVQNAVRLTPPGGSVVLRADGTPERVRFEVQDTGPGIPAEELPLVFERLHTVEPSRARPHSGSGLGLAIAAEIVHAHGGVIGVDSAPGSGARFSFELPRRTPGPAKAAAAGR